MFFNLDFLCGFQIFLRPTKLGELCAHPNVNQDYQYQYRVLKTKIYFFFQRDEHKYSERTQDKKQTYLHALMEFTTVGNRTIALANLRPILHSCAIRKCLKN